MEILRDTGRRYGAKKPIRRSPRSGQGSEWALECRYRECGNRSSSDGRASVFSPAVWGKQSSWPSIPGGIMGQILHGRATTTHAIRAAIRRSKAPLKELATRYGLNPKKVAKWRNRSFLDDAPMGPKTPRSTVLAPEEKAMAVAFRQHTAPAGSSRTTSPHSSTPT